MLISEYGSSYPVRLIIKSNGDNMCNCIDNNDDDYDLGDFNLVEDCLPEDKEQVLVIVQSHYSGDCGIQASTFNPQIGWACGGKVLAWQEIDSDLTKFMKDKTKDFLKAQKKSGC